VSTLAISCSTLSTTPSKNLSLKSTKAVINPCHRFSAFTSVVDTGNKFITSVNDTGKQLSLVTMTLNKFNAGDKNP
jgi:hypothetical protein